MARTWLVEVTPVRTVRAYQRQAPTASPGAPRGEGEGTHLRFQMETEID